MARPRNLHHDPVPRVVSQGTVSKPRALPRWRPTGRLAVDVTPYSVKARGNSTNG